MSSTKSSLNLGQTAVEKSVQYEAEQQAKEQKSKSRSKPRKQKSPQGIQLPAAELYRLGQEAMPGSGARAIFDPVRGRFMGHILYVEDAPMQVVGLNYPDNFKVLRPIKTDRDLQIFNESIQSLSPSPNESVNQAVRAFWAPVSRPKSEEARESALIEYAENKVLIYKAQEESARNEPLELNHAFNPAESVDCIPTSFVPPRSAFNDLIQSELTPERLFPLFPEPELGLFMLWLGRVGVGPSNHIPAGQIKPIFHTSRIGIIILGKQAGLGKSYQMDKIRSAMYKVGMTFETVRSTGERFGGGRYVCAFVAYKDDTDKKNLTLLASHENTKTIISGGELVVEDKHVQAVPVVPICALCFNANEIDMNMVYGLDPGIIDRIKILNTRTRDQLEDINKELYPDPLDRPPSLEPAIYLPWLAKHYGCDIEALMLWGIRLATDTFWDAVKDGDVTKLRKMTHRFANRCEVKFMPHIRQALMRSFIVSLLLTSEKDLKFIPEFSYKMLLKSLLAYKKVQGGLVNISNLLKQDWEQAERSPLHPWQGFREIWLPSVLEAIQAHEAEVEGNWQGQQKGVKFDKATSSVMSMIYTRSGQQVSGGFTYLSESWNDARRELRTLRRLVASMKSNLNPEELKYLHDSKLEINCDWALDVNYSPEIAQHIRPTLKSSEEKSLEL